MRLSILAIFIFLSRSAECQQPVSICVYKQIEFDSDTCCWRQLSKQEAFLEAGKLIKQYLECSNAKNIHSLNWHAGQMYASAGLNTKAIKYFKKTYSLFTKWFGGKDGLAWFLYAKGTIHFLNGKHNSLKKIIAKWDRKLEKDLNYASLLKLQSSFQMAYSDALK